MEWQGPRKCAIISGLSEKKKTVKDTRIIHSTKKSSLSMKNRRLEGAYMIQN